MLSKWISFLPFALALGCRLGTPRSDDNAGARAAAPGPTAPASSRAPAAPAILALPDADAPAAAASPTPTAKSAARARRRVVVLGDSLSDPRVGGGGYIATVQRACSHVTVENLAKGGWMVNQIRRRYQTEVAPRLSEFSDLIVFGGVNDLYSDETAGRSVEKIIADLSIIYGGAKAKGLRVIALTVTPWGGFNRYYNPRRAAATERLNAWIRSQEGGGLVDVVVDAHPELACGDRERLCADYQAPFRDGLHFGKLGHDRLGALLLSRAFADCARPASELR